MEIFSITWNEWECERKMKERLHKKECVMIPLGKFFFWEVVVGESYRNVIQENNSFSMKNDKTISSCETPFWFRPFKAFLLNHSFFMYSVCQFNFVLLELVEWRWKVLMFRFLRRISIYLRLSFFLLTNISILVYIGSYIIKVR